MTLTVTNAWNQRGWDANDHLMDDRISDMIGRSYASFSSLKRAAYRLSDSYPTVDYHDGHQRYSWDGSPDLPGRYSSGIKELGPL